MSRAKTEWVLGCDELYPHFYMVGKKNEGVAHYEDQPTIKLTVEEREEYLQAYRIFHEWQERLKKAYGYDD
ncbi:MAG: hypothetical protein KGL39_37795 [Patescibacteria group bacterium]|nr:hypothetical protein [Patescibacteria group bacterium]